LGYLFAHRRIKEQACDTVFGAFAFLGKPVSSWLNDDEFKIKSISRIDDRVRMAFTSQGPPQDDREFAGSIDFLPDRQWVIDSWDITITAPKEGRSWRDQVKLTYGGDDPVPRLVGTTLVALHPMLQSTSTTVVDELVFAPTPDDSFRLSSYGYSDRVGLPARLIDSIWFWVGIVGLLCLMAAFVLRYRMQATQAN
jgi:hypothetical protein